MIEQGNGEDHSGEVRKNPRRQFLRRFGTTIAALASSALIPVDSNASTKIIPDELLTSTPPRIPANPRISEDIISGPQEAYQKTTQITPSQEEPTNNQDAAAVESQPEKEVLTVEKVNERIKQSRDSRGAKFYGYVFKQPPLESKGLRQSEYAFPCTGFNTIPDELKEGALSLYTQAHGLILNLGLTPYVSGVQLRTSENSTVDFIEGKASKLVFNVNNWYSRGKSEKDFEKTLAPHELGHLLDLTEGNQFILDHLTLEKALDLISQRENLLLTHFKLVTTDSKYINPYDQLKTGARDLPTQIWASENEVIANLFADYICKRPNNYPEYLQREAEKYFNNCLAVYSRKAS